MCKSYLNDTDEQTDGHADRQTTTGAITALCAVSRGKNTLIK